MSGKSLTSLPSASCVKTPLSTSAGKVLTKPPVNKSRAEAAGRRLASIEQTVSDPNKRRRTDPGPDAFPTEPTKERRSFVDKLPKAQGAPRRVQASMSSEETMAVEYADVTYEEDEEELVAPRSLKAQRQRYQERYQEDEEMAPPRKKAQDECFVDDKDEVTAAPKKPVRQRILDAENEEDRMPTAEGSAGLVHKARSKGKAVLVGMQRMCFPFRNLHADGRNVNLLGGNPNIALKGVSAELAARAQWAEAGMQQVELEEGALWRVHDAWVARRHLHYAHVTALALAELAGLQSNDFALNVAQEDPLGLQELPWALFREPLLAAFMAMVPEAEDYEE
ncbi:hypothetical protein FA95DRAFT_1609771 [Auriscalpium vulgare]|uniref:Uncharacterized protein n=1 Tax=Auriscalpium vulgare TaxID=40419 RepID=A0ACB8RFP2_9AGAM|nr:hypothetical protein FA95DRAFT_1609771 [Auriscalpium vulgare]